MTDSSARISQLEREHDLSKRVAAQALRERGDYLRRIALLERLLADSGRVHKATEALFAVQPPEKRCAHLAVRARDLAARIERAIPKTEVVAERQVRCSACHQAKPLGRPCEHCGNRHGVPLTEDRT